MLFRSVYNSIFVVFISMNLNGGRIRRNKGNIQIK